MAAGATSSSSSLINLTASGDISRIDRTCMAEGRGCVPRAVPPRTSAQQALSAVPLVATLPRKVEIVWAGLPDFRFHLLQARRPSADYLPVSRDPVGTPSGEKRPARTPDSAPRA